MIPTVYKLYLATVAVGLFHRWTGWIIGVLLFQTLGNNVWEQSSVFYTVFPVQWFCFLFTPLICLWLFCNGKHGHNYNHSCFSGFKLLSDFRSGFPVPNSLGVIRDMPVLVLTAPRERLHTELLSRPQSQRTFPPTKDGTIEGQYFRWKLCWNMLKTRWQQIYS